MHRALALKSVRRYVKNCPYSPIPLEITENETWDFNIKLYTDIIIKQGVTLTITCKVLMPDQAKIIPIVVNITHKNSLYSIPEKIGIPAMLCAIPIVKGLVTPPMNPKVAPTNTTLTPTMLS